MIIHEKMLLAYGIAEVKNIIQKPPNKEEKMENKKSKDEALCAVIIMMALYMTVSLGLTVFFDSRPTGGERFVLLIFTVFFGKMAWLAGRKLAILTKMP